MGYIIHVDFREAQCINVQNTANPNKQRVQANGPQHRFTDKELDYFDKFKRRIEKELGPSKIHPHENVGHQIIQHKECYTEITGLYNDMSFVIIAPQETALARFIFAKSHLPTKKGLCYNFNAFAAKPPPNAQDSFIHDTLDINLKIWRPQQPAGFSSIQQMQKSAETILTKISNFKQLHCSS